MDGDRLKDKLEGIVRPVVESLGFELWGMEFLSGGRGGLLRVFIESPQGISISHCKEVSKHLDVVLDVEDPIPGPYTLEVSSPGMERRFFHIHQLPPYLGKMMALRTREAVEGRKRWRGRLCAVREEVEELVLDVEGEERVFSWNEIETINLLYWVEA